MSSQEILEIISSRNRLQVAVRGGVAEHHLERVLRADPAVEYVRRLDQEALHDFDVTLFDGRQARVECKNASPEPYADGTYKVEVQKTRASKNDPTSRFYRVDQFDVVAACMYSPTGQWSFATRRPANSRDTEIIHSTLPPSSASTTDGLPSWASRYDATAAAGASALKCRT